MLVSRDRDGHPLALAKVILPFAQPMQTCDRTTPQHRPTAESAIALNQDAASKSPQRDRQGPK